MDRQNPPRLVDLASQSLLEDEAAAMAALQSLPRECFPPLFVLAVARRRCRMVQAMVEAWPFPYLPLGALLEAPQCDQEILKAALSGIDALLARDFRPTRWKLQVLDLRSDAETNFWHKWAGLGDGISASPLRESGASQPNPERHRVGPSSTWEKQKFASTEVLVLFSDLCFMEPSPDELLTFLVKRVMQNKLIPRLCCRKLEILHKPLENAIMHRILEKVELARVEQLEVNCEWNLVDLAWFVPFLGQMIHLNRLLLSDVQVHACSISSGTVNRLWDKFTTQLSKLQQLQHLHLDSVHFLAGRLPQMFNSPRPAPCAQLPTPRSPRWQLPEPSSPRPETLHWKLPTLAAPHAQAPRAQLPTPSSLHPAPHAQLPTLAAPHAQKPCTGSSPRPAPRAGSSLHPAPHTQLPRTQLSMLAVPCAQLPVLSLR
ncbi:PREDICTED: melanoma antigen preferentially expressed in tumors-like [Elephantulus edwardii]|uniref:melanoma antigen preferentially expressed in tumors-like n=1 Tax=Elephantulus edwardii TaxID=28737 RepID=UPI0003F06304|nr:PREDICTED: melanoma antigen preferentially expressed in tumors-like [Elephantulus edwardii]